MGAIFSSFSFGFRQLTGMGPLEIQVLEMKGRNAEDKLKFYFFIMLKFNGSRFTVGENNQNQKEMLHYLTGCNLAGGIDML